MNLRMKPIAIALVSALASPVAAQTPLDAVVVTASRTEQAAFDASGSIDLISREQIEAAGPQINISEALAAVPGITVANRNNYAQDLQISVRGYGARAPFGVRGVRLYVDGLPLTLPDGQGQTSQFAATSAARMEVLKGPLAALYGNASGGVIQVLTRDPMESPEVSAYYAFGSDDLRRTSLQFSDTAGEWGIVADYGAFSSTGFRDASAAERDHFNFKLLRKGENSSRTTVILNSLDQKKSEDPGTLTLAEFNASPYQAAAANKQNKAGKSFVQNLAGLVYETSAEGWEMLRLTGYLATRDLDNPGNGVTYILLDRAQHGVSGFGERRAMIGGTPVRLTTGLELDSVKDARKQQTNSQGQPTGPLRRNEDNIAFSSGAFASLDWYLNERWSLTTGLRLSSVSLEVDDYFLTDNLDGSGSRQYQGLGLVVGATRHLSPATNLFVNLGRSIETPTLNEVIYKESGGRSVNQFNADLNAAQNDQLELGLKHREGRDAYTAAIIYGRTQDEIVPLRLSPFSATWQNADTTRMGAEFAFTKFLSPTLRWNGSLAFLSAEYDEQISIIGPIAYTIRPGNKLVNIPETSAQTEIAWNSARFNPLALNAWEAAVELVHLGPVQARSDNLESTASTTLLNLRASYTTPLLGGRLRAFVRFDNLTDEIYASSIKGDESSAAYYEAGAPRSVLVGVSYTKTF